MDDSKKHRRKDELHDVLAYCTASQNAGKIYVFTAVERIFINQERGSLFSQLNTDNFPHEIRYSEIPPAIEAKVKLTLEKIKASGWRPEF